MHKNRDTMNLMTYESTGAKKDTLLRIIVSILILTSVCMSSMVAIVHASTTTRITNSQGGLYFTGTSSDPGTFYQDAIGGNIDAGLRLCGQGQRYVGGFYAINVSSTPIYTLLTYQSSSDALAYTDSIVGGGCFDVTPGFLTFSPSQLSTPDPDVFKAAFPGFIWTGYAVNTNPGTISGFDVGRNDSLLRGNYTATRSFDYSTRQVTVQMPQITFESDSSNITKSASDAQFGISTDRKFVGGLCIDSYGSDCSDGAVYTSSASFPAAYDSDLNAGQIVDSNTFTRYVVFNGIGLPICIGANLQLTIDDISPVPSYYSQNITIQTTLKNNLDSPYELTGGNIPVTTPFMINLAIYNGSNFVVYNNSFTISTSLLPGATTAYNITYPAFARSGLYTVLATVDYNSNISECNESDNTANTSMYLYPVTIPVIKIDGVTTSAFAYPNIPYVVNVSLTDSDNYSVSNATVQFVEVNGLNINGGTQVYNISASPSTTSLSGVIGTSIVQVTTNHEGNVSFSYIPTYNQLYESQYSYLQLTQYIGSMQRYMAGSLNNGSSMVFVVNNTVTSQYPFTVTSLTYNVTVTPKSILNNATIAQSFDNIYRTFTNFLSALIG